MFNEHIASIESLPVIYADASKDSITKNTNKEKLTKKNTVHQLSLTIDLNGNFTNRFTQECPIIIRNLIDITPDTLRMKRTQTAARKDI